MEYPFPKLATYLHMNPAQIEQAYANIEQHFGRRERLPAPLFNQPWAQNGHQRAAMHMDLLRDRIANHEQYRAEWQANVAREQARRRLMLFPTPPTPDDTADRGVSIVHLFYFWAREPSPSPVLAPSLLGGGQFIPTVLFHCQ